QIHGKKLFNLALKRGGGPSGLVLKSSLEESLRGKEAAEMLGHYGVRYVLLHRDRPGISFYEDENEAED
ncbi:hypothetical protein HKBW3S42_02422, partial [Candidatus Hakubella thermalkaliphila]